MKVLLIEDSPIMRMMLKSLLGQLRLTDIVEAGNGSDGLTILKQQQIDLIMLDVHMPVMDGMTFLTEMKKIPDKINIPVIIVSSDSEQAQIVEALQNGARAYVTKPFKIEKLQSALKTALHNWK